MTIINLIINLMTIINLIINFMVQHPITVINVTVWFVFIVYIIYVISIDEDVYEDIDEEGNKNGNR